MDFSKDLFSKKSEMVIVLIIAATLGTKNVLVMTVEFIVFTWSVWDFFSTFGFFGKKDKVDSALFAQYCCMAFVS